MSTKTSPPLSPPIQTTFYGTDEVKTFERISDVVDWALAQQEAWFDAKPSQHHLAQQWNGQRSHAATVRSTATALGTMLEKPEEERSPHETQQIAQYGQNLRQLLDAYASNRVLSTSHPHFAHIQAVAESDDSAGAALLSAYLPNGASILGKNNTLDAIARIGVAAAASLGDARKKTIKSLRTELSVLRKKAEADIESWRTTIDEHTRATKANVTEHEAAVEKRDREMKELFERFGAEWEDLKRVYDEKLALLAPTEYWRTRATAHRDKAKGYAVAFGVGLAILLGLFVYFAIDHLKVPDTSSVLLAVLPVLIPAFAGVWVLRILGRLLSENLAIAQDASERETMVKTFLSLMRDETTGKSVVTDEDRKIILHALFRPSAVTSTDDSPPVHWIQTIKPSK